MQERKMTYDELHTDGILRAVPVRVRLTQADAGTRWPAWRLKEECKRVDLCRHVFPIALRLVRIGGSTCCALEGRVEYWKEERQWALTKRPFVYLLSPAEPSAWRAIDSWFEAKGFAMEHASGQLSLFRLSARDRSVLEARYAEGEELESDMLAGNITELLESGRLETVLAKQLGLLGPMDCAIVETPMLLKSLQPYDPQEWKLHTERELERGLNEGIWS